MGKCSTGCGKQAERGKDLCVGCEAAFKRMYPDLAGRDQDQDQGKKADMAAKKAEKKGFKAETLPEALRALEPADLADRLYEVVAGDTAPEVYGLADRGQAVSALKAMGSDYKATLARAEHVFSEKAPKDPQPKAAPKKSARPEPIDLPGGPEEEAGEPAPPPPPPAPAGEEPKEKADAEEPVPLSDPKAAIRGGGKGGVAGAPPPAWRSSPARIIRAALVPLDPKWCDWDALERAGLKGVKAARSLLQHALEYQERVEAAAAGKGGGKAPAGEVKVGAVTRVRARFAKEYEGALSAEEQAHLEVTNMVGSVAHCKTTEGERVIVPVKHLEVCPAA